MNTIQKHWNLLSITRIGFFMLPLCLIGCVRTIAVTESERYNDQMVEVITKDSISYKLASGWKTDSLQNVSGRGLRVTHDSTEKFHGTIASSSIDKLVVVDSVTPAIEIVLVAIVVGLTSVLIAMEH